MVGIGCKWKRERECVYMHHGAQRKILVVSLFPPAMDYITRYKNNKRS